MTRIAVPPEAIPVGALSADLFSNATALKALSFPMRQRRSGCRAAEPAALPPARETPASPLNAARSCAILPFRNQAGRGGKREWAHIGDRRFPRLRPSLRRSRWTAAGVWCGESGPETMAGTSVGLLARCSGAIGSSPSATPKRDEDLAGRASRLRPRLRPLSHRTS
jgi:hypothetical protein